MNIIKHDPSFLFYNWKLLSDSVSHNRQQNSNADDFITDKDEYIDSLRSGNTTYSNCNQPFNHARQIIEIPQYSEDDVAFVKSLAHKGQKVYILFTPIPNIRENIDALSQASRAIKRLPDCLNQPVVMDSTYFYDQWYHLNKCGQEKETQKMIALLTDLNARKALP